METKNVLSNTNKYKYMYATNIIYCYKTPKNAYISTTCILHAVSSMRVYAAMNIL